MATAESVLNCKQRRKKGTVFKVKWKLPCRTSIQLYSQRYRIQFDLRNISPTVFFIKYWIYLSLLTQSMYIVSGVIHSRERSRLRPLYIDVLMSRTVDSLWRQWPQSGAFSVDSVLNCQQIRRKQHWIQSRRRAVVSDVNAAIHSDCRRMRSQWQTVSFSATSLAVENTLDWRRCIAVLSPTWQLSFDLEPKIFFSGSVCS